MPSMKMDWVPIVQFMARIIGADPVHATNTSNGDLNLAPDPLSLDPTGLGLSLEAAYANGPNNLDDTFR